MRQQMRGARNRFPRPLPPQNPKAQNKKRQERGLNENYGRELMELHTLGVDGGYTQKDVTEVARCSLAGPLRSLAKIRNSNLTNASTILIRKSFLEKRFMLVA